MHKDSSVLATGTGELILDKVPSKEDSVRRLLVGGAATSWTVSRLPLDASRGHLQAKQTPHLLGVVSFPHVSHLIDFCSVIACELRFCTVQVNRKNE
jgi:hypothetical protein